MRAKPMSALVQLHVENGGVARRMVCLSGEYQPLVGGAPHANLRLERNINNSSIRFTDVYGT